MRRRAAFWGSLANSSFSSGVLRSRQQRVAVRALTARPERVETINKQHRAIADAISRHDAESGLRLLELHLRPLSEITSALPTDE